MAWSRLVSAWMWTTTIVVGCGGEDGGTDDGAGTGASTTGTTTSTASTEPSASTDDGETGCRVGCCHLCSDSSCGDGPGGCTSSGETQGPTTTSGVSACDGLAEPACEQTPTCLPLRGGLVVDAGENGYCSETPTFFECVEELACGAAVTYVCPPGKTDVYVFSSTCYPNGWNACRPPADVIPPCP